MTVPIADRPQRRVGVRVVWGVVLCIVTTLLLPTFWTNVEPLHSRKAERHGFYDMRLWVGAANGYFDRTGSLYDTEVEGYFVPGSHSKYKYPPFYASLLRSMHGIKRLPLVFAWAFLVIYFLSAVATIWASPSRSWMRWWGVLLVALAWQPLYENFADLAMEGLLLFLFAVGAALLSYERIALWGVMLGVAAGVKIYPGALLGLPLIWSILPPAGHGARQSRWKSLRAYAGALVGFAATLAVGLVVFPPQITWQFFHDILPRIGGVSLSYESVGLASTIGRTLVLSTGGLPAGETLDIQTLEQFGSSAQQALTWGVWGAVFALLGIATVRKLRLRATQFQAALALLVAALPTSWAAYQALLFLPLAYGFLRLPSLGLPDRLVPDLGLDESSPARSLGAWALAAFAIVGGLVSLSGDRFWSAPALYAWVRALLPFSIWTLLILLDARPARPVPEPSV